MISDYLGVDSPPETPELFTMPDAIFSALENNRYLPLKEYETKWIRSDPEPRMPELYLPLTPAQRDLVLGALLVELTVGGDKPDPLLPPLAMGRMGVFSASLYVPNFSMLGKRETYSAVIARAIIRHREGIGASRRHDAIQTFYDLHGVPQNASVQLPIRFRDRKGELQVQGGDLSAVCLWEPTIMGGAVVALGARIKYKVRARNPGYPHRIQATIRAEIARQAKANGLSAGRTNELLVIAWKESRQLQFEIAGAKGGREGLPRQGASQNDWGIFQLNVLPFSKSTEEGYGPILRKGQIIGYPPTRKQLWDWRENIDCGIRLYKRKITEAEAYLKRQYEAGRKLDPAGVRHLTQRQNRLECMERFNGGAYWSHWSADKQQWVRRLPKLPPYADELIGRVEGLEHNPQTFPEGWNVT